VVFHDDSGPYISTILPFAYHPHKATSSDIDHEDTVSTFIPSFSHNFITAPFQNCFSIIASACAKASFLSICIKILYNKVYFEYINIYLSVKSF
jgi:hypothetical protein